MPHRLLSSISDAIGINIHESSERATPRERNEMVLVNQNPAAFNTIAYRVGVGVASEAMLELELALD